MRLRRGDVWWAQLDPTRGSEISKTRPCVIVSANQAIERRKTVVVVPLSSTPNEHPPFTVKVHCEGRRVSAIADQIRALAKERLTARIETMDGTELKAIEAALRLVLEL